MRLSVVFVLTLAVSVIVSATATWGLTYSTSYGELRDMASGFVGLATVSVADFAQLVRRLIGDSSALVSSILDTEYLRSVAQLNATGQEFLSSTLDLMARAKNSTTQAQGLVTALVISFGRFMGTVITEFEAVGTDYASRLRTESASRTQTIFSSMLQDRILALQRQARLYEMGLLDVSRQADQPLDDGSCTLLGLLCATSAELQRDMFIGTAGGDMMLCDVTNVSYALYKRKGAGSETVIFYQWPPYIAGSTNFTAWKEACLAGSTSTFMNETCADGTQMEFPSCNGTCGYDPRCRTWYSVHYGTQAAVTQMSAVYIDIQRQVPVVTLSYPLYTGSPPTLAAVAASDFFFSDVDAFLATLSTSQLAAVVFNSSDLLVVGTNVACTNATAQASGVGIADACSPALRGLGLWLAAHRGLAHNVSLELAGTLWDVFPGVVDNFSYFVAVGMNKSEVYAVITNITETSNETLQAMYSQQTARMAQLEAASLAEMDAVSAERVASLQVLQAENQLHLIEMQNQTDQAFNASRLKSAQDLSTLTSAEMGSIQQLEDYHLSRVSDSIGTTFGAVVGIGLGILLLGSYGTWVVTKQVQKITQVIEDVAQMKVETLEVAQKSPIREVQRIEAALGVLVGRLAEYKTYMPAGLFQQGDHPEELEAHPSVLQQTAGKRLGSTHRSSTTNSLSTSRSTAVCVAAVATATRLLRRSAVAMVVNVAHFQADLVQRSAGQLEATLNRLISVVHSAASKAQGNIDAILGDQILVTFNAHFPCSDPPSAASNVALEVMEALKGEPAFPGRVQIGMAAGPVHVGHLGYAAFKAMVAMGAPMKVASLLAHLSGFREPVALMCPAMEERVKYHFTVQPVDLVALPIMGEFVSLYAKSISIFSLVARIAVGHEAAEWLYQIDTTASSGHWAETFRAVARANTTAEARATLGAYLADHGGDALAQRLLGRLPHWQPHVGLTLAERPDGWREDSLLDSPSAVHLTLRSLR